MLRQSCERCRGVVLLVLPKQIHGMSDSTKNLAVLFLLFPAFLSASLAVVFYFSDFPLSTRRVLVAFLAAASILIFGAVVLLLVLRRSRQLKFEKPTMARTAEPERTRRPVKLQARTTKVQAEPEIFETSQAQVLEARLLSRVRRISESISEIDRNIRRYVLDVSAIDDYLKKLGLFLYIPDRAIVDRLSDEAVKKDPDIEKYEKLTRFREYVEILDDDQVEKIYNDVSARGGNVLDLLKELRLAVRRKQRQESVKRKSKTKPRMTRRLRRRGRVYRGMYKLKKKSEEQRPIEWGLEDWEVEELSPEDVLRLTLKKLI